MVGKLLGSLDQFVVPVYDIEANSVLQLSEAYRTEVDGLSVVLLQRIAPIHDALIVSAVLDGK